MRRYRSIVKATALEILSEPLSLLLLLAAVALSVLAPAFHYHQFGEATRMARDAGLSALFTCGTAFAVFGTIRAIRREIESGTLEMALAHPVSRPGFFLAKTAGAFVAYLFFAVILMATVGVVVNGAAIGGRLATRCGDLARLWGPSMAIGLAVAVLPLALGALLNRFLRCRFMLTAMGTAMTVAVAGALAYRPDFALYLRLLPVALLLVVMATVFLSAAAALAIRFKANAAAAGVGLIVIVAIAFLGNYYMADALQKDGSLGWDYVALATLAALPAVAGFLLLGVHFSDGIE